MKRRKAVPYKTFKMLSDVELAGLTLDQLYRLKETVRSTTSNYRARIIATIGMKEMQKHQPIA